MPPVISAHSPDQTSNAWGELVERFGDRISNDDAIYSLPMKLIRALRTHAPQILKAKDATFERALRKTAGTGFRRRQPFACPIVEAKQNAEVAAKLFGDPRQEIIRQARLSMHASASFSGPAAAMFPEVNQSIPIATGEVEGMRSIQRQVEEDALSHQYGYAGWLLTNHEFHLDRCHLQAVWNGRSYLASACPTRARAESLMAIGERDFPGNGAELHALSDIRAGTLNFFNKWGLDGMWTWDLPILSAPKQLMCETIPAADPNSPGITLFIPWSLLASRELNLTKIIQYHQCRQNLSHLNGWLFDTHKKNEDWGVLKCGHLLPLYVYIQLALRRRYADRLDGQIKLLDPVFAEYFSTTTPQNNGRPWSAGSIRKIRERMEKRLSGESTDRRVRSQSS